MNLCRTCKRWVPREHMIGVGFCNNSEVWLRMIQSGDQPTLFAQDFGCVLHEEGPTTANLLTPEVRQQILDEYFRSQRPFPT